MKLQQEFFTVSETAAKLGLSEDAVIHLTELEQLSICFRHKGEIDVISRVGPDGTDYSHEALGFKGVLRCMQPPTDDQEINEWGVLVSVLRSDTLCLKTGQIYRLPTVDPPRGYLKPGHEVVGFVEANVPREKWMFHIDDLARIATIKPPAPGVPASDAKPWLLIDPRDPPIAPPKDQPWYTPARYFARQLVVGDSTLLTKKLVLAGKVSTSLAGAGIYKRGGKKAHLAVTVLKAFANVTMG